MSAPTYTPKLEGPASLWSNVGGTISPGANRVAVGADAIPNAARLYVRGESADWTGVQYFENFAKGNGESAGLVISYDDGAFTGAFSVGLQVRNRVPNRGGGLWVIDGREASYGLDVLSDIDGARSPLGQISGANCAIQGYATGIQVVNAGISGVAFGPTAGSTSIGVAGVAIKPLVAAGSKEVALMGEVKTLGDTNIEPTVPRSTALLLDNRSTGAPLVIGQTNGKLRFEFDAEGRLILRAPSGRGVALSVDDSGAVPVLKQTAVP